MANANQVVVGANGKVWVAPITSSGGPAGPTNSGTALAAGWMDVGYITEDGVTFTEGKDITDIGAWQSFYPIRYIVNSRLVTASFSMRQWNSATVEFALGGDVTGGPTEFKYEPPAPEVLDLRQMVIEWFDNTKTYRLYIRQGLVTENVETNLVRTDSAVLPITFGAMDPGGANKIYSMYTNDINFSLSS